METFADLDLPYLPLSDPEFSLDPFGRFAEARRQHPWLAKCDFGYVVTEYAAMRELMAFDDKMALGYGGAVEMMGAADTDWGRFIINSVQVATGERHKRLRDVLAPAFTPREANRHRGLMRETISRLLDEWTAAGAMDFELFASHFPISVMCRIIGASPSVVPTLRASLEILGVGGSFEASYVPKFQEAFLVVDGFVRELVAGRRAGERLHPEPDLLDTLLQTVDEGGIDDAELYNLLVFLFTAGYDTSKNVLTLTMHQLLDRPEMYERCARDPAFCRKVVEEISRFNGVASSPRLILEPFEFRGFHLPKGMMLYLPWGASGRDPGAFEDADVFDPDRKRRNAAMVFGLGPHMCLGQFIARANIEEGLHLIAQRITRPRRAGANRWREFPGVWGIRGLPIEFTPADAPAPAPASAA
jgi:cytochrome P450